MAQLCSNVFFLVFLFTLLVFFILMTFYMFGNDLNLCFGFGWNQNDPD